MNVTYILVLLLIAILLIAAIVGIEVFLAKKVAKHLDKGELGFAALYALGAFCILAIGLA